MYVFKYCFSDRDVQTTHDSFTVFDDCLVFVVSNNPSNRFQGCLIMPHSTYQLLYLLWYSTFNVCTSLFARDNMYQHYFQQLDVTIVCNKVTPELSAHTDYGRH